MGHIIDEKVTYFLNNISNLAFSLLNTPYKWGGATPMDGLDCSGFALVLLKSVGLVAGLRDMTADYMDDYLIQLGGEIIDKPKMGSFIFYGSDYRAKHVMYCINDYQCIGAQGGGSRTKTIDNAVRDEAYVKILPWNYRNDIIQIININKILGEIS